MSTRANALLILASLAAAALFTLARTLPPAPLPADAPATEFSALRAIQHVQAIAQRPRPTGSAENAKAREYILSALQGLGVATDTQREGDLVNVLGRLVGTRSSDGVLLTAHLDSVAQAPGATDDGSGVAVLLETARALVAAGPYPNTVMFLFTDFEEGGTVGAQAFISHHPWAQDVQVVIGLDAGGLAGPGVLSATSADNGWLIEQLAQSDGSVVDSSAINALAESGTDFGGALKPAGFSGYAFDLYWDRRIHTPEDNVQNLDLSSLQHQGYHALSLARHFAELHQLVDPREPDAVYFSVLRLFVISYPSTWAVPLAAVGMVLFVLLLAGGLRWRILTWGGMSYGALALVVSFLIAPLPTLLFGKWASGLPFRFVGRALDRPPQVAAVFLCTLVLIVLWYALSRKLRNTCLHDLTIGALLPLSVAMLGIAIVLPALSFLLTWPLLLSLLACANWFYWEARGERPKGVMPILIICGAADIVMLGPTLMLGLFDQMALTSLLVAVLCGFLVPQIHLILGASIDNPRHARPLAAAR